jgi:hypothetical protein
VKMSLRSDNNLALMDKLPSGIEPEGRMRTRYHYHVCGLRLLSDTSFPFPETGSDGRQPDLEFSLGATGTKTEDLFPARKPHGIIRNGAGWPSITVYKMDQRYLLSCSNEASRVDFVLSDDCRRIDCYPFTAESRRNVELWLFGLVLAFILQVRGVFSLHASAVVVDGGAISFLGKNGYGKSTLAYFFLQKGHPVITDDLLAFERKGDAFHALPACPSMNLWDTTVSQWCGTGGNLGDEIVRKVKGRHSLASLDGVFCSSDIPLKSIYLLNPRSEEGDSEVRILPVVPSKALFELIGYTRANSMVEHGSQKELFLTYASLVSEVPVRRLEYPSGFDFLPTIYDAVLRDMVC